MTERRFSKEELSTGFIPVKKYFEICLWIETIGDERVLIKENIRAQWCEIVDDALTFFCRELGGDLTIVGSFKHWSYWKEIPSAQ